ncbi:MAG: hypothetical protein CM1200mP41_39940 [Gammaproteobacteria bacterium]|nr:MAG: hypothetical protein CM1200mP41_39940 [Gammaproteobacteria bacterium]
MGCQGCVAEPRGCVLCFSEYHRDGDGCATLQNRLLEEAGVATVAGTSFGAMGKGFVRFS